MARPMAIRGFYRDRRFVRSVMLSEPPLAGAWWT
jgi:hypothetical protein